MRHKTLFLVLLGLFVFLAGCPDVFAADPLQHGAIIRIQRAPRVVERVTIEDQSAAIRQRVQYAIRRPEPRTQGIQC